MNRELPRLVAELLGRHLAGERPAARGGDVRAHARVREGAAESVGGAAEDMGSGERATHARSKVQKHAGRADGVAQEVHHEQQEQQPEAVVDQGVHAVRGELVVCSHKRTG